jgi:anthranilate synthase/aminodeoxychorismate synthase-like glutamine amidotransferase
MIDNYDSFTYNLVQLLSVIDPDIKVFRNDEITIEEIDSLNPDYIVISPGPGVPNEAGISKEIIKKLGKKIPVLGICLGHQCIGEVFGGRVSRAKKLMHGKTSPIYHYSNEIFSGIKNPFTATRYHSLIVEEENLPEELEIIAFTEGGTIMALKHRDFPIYGLQFHPESILTIKGKQILKNFLQVNKRKPMVIPNA